jgi:hypothetical protein
MLAPSMPIASPLVIVKPARQTRGKEACACFLPTECGIAALHNGNLRIGKLAGVASNVYYGHSVCDFPAGFADTRN